LPANSSKIRVLIVDDSAIVRKLLSAALADAGDIEVVGTAPDPYVARDKILALEPDVVTLDIEMPRMDGLTFLKKIMRYKPLPVIVISSLGQAGCRAALDALQSGAIDVLAKPGGPYSVGELQTTLAAKIRAAAAARFRRPAAVLDPAPATASAALKSSAGRDGGRWPTSTLIAIGASTGGTEAIREVLMGLPGDVPGIVIAQHIPPVFSHAFAKRLNEICPMEVKEAESGDAVRPGLALVAPGDYHLIVHRAGAGYGVELRQSPRVCHQRPSVDVLFASVAEAAGANAVGALLTGMGADGANGMLAMRRAGARTIAQDEATCVVFGMPREAIERGAAEHVTPLPAIASTILRLAPQESAPAPRDSVTVPI
jgi:two-component system chemotaxis response regulator CheB